MEMLDKELCDTGVKKLSPNKPVPISKRNVLRKRGCESSKKEDIVKNLSNEIIILDKNVPVSVKLLSKEEPIVENIVSFEVEPSEAEKNATKDDSVLDESVPNDLQVPIITSTTPIQKPIVKDTAIFEDAGCYARKTATINGSFLDQNVPNDQHVPVIVSPKVPEKQLNEITSENDKQKDASKPPTKSQNMAEATSFKTGDYVILFSSDGKRIFSSASLLIRHSYIFATILKNIKKSPVKINVEEYNSDIIYSALDFLNGKNDAINGKEIQLYHFSDKYSLRDLKKAVCSKFDKLLSLKNVCEIIQIAYENYFEELKLKCIEMIQLNSEKIGKSELKTLPTEIYDEIFI